MNQQTKQRKLEEAGFQVGTTADFLSLTPEEEAIVEMRLALAQRLRTLRTRRQMTQAALAKTIESSQSRVAKMESGDSSVSMDLMMKSLIRLGETPAEIGRIFSLCPWRPRTKSPREKATRRAKSKV